MKEGKKEGKKERYSGHSNDKNSAGRNKSCDVMNQSPSVDHVDSPQSHVQPQSTLATPPSLFYSSAYSPPFNNYCYNHQQNMVHQPQPQQYQPQPYCSYYSSYNSTSPLMQQNKSYLPGYELMVGHNNGNTAGALNRVRNFPEDGLNESYPANKWFNNYHSSNNNINHNHQNINSNNTNISSYQCNYYHFYNYNNSSHYNQHNKETTQSCFPYEATNESCPYLCNDQEGSVKKLMQKITSQEFFHTLK
ncbi:hypothetical protein HELRODRAFT_170913 [Helobdella robusta]|uniref:Uncharacterized protein n=1 Tax=Helobdella robusta TaxID=6412 RepID=T1F3L3_HELRO|nr:hypothetical protein HELRODRAFT_170913 [Helobdella robusta]ESO06882.1 hypothetical protein HELRODRAFT_170913 [Helobdella robusta]